MPKGRFKNILYCIKDPLLLPLLPHKCSYSSPSGISTTQRIANTAHLPSTTPLFFSIKELLLSNKRLSQLIWSPWKASPRGCSNMTTEHKVIWTIHIPFTITYHWGERHQEGCLIWSIIQAIRHKYASFHKLQSKSTTVMWEVFWPSKLQTWAEKRKRRVIH